MFTVFIVILVETEIKGLSAATAILDTVADKVVSAFENDFTLTGTVDWCNPVNGPRDELETPQGLVVSQQLNLKCNVAVPVI